MKIFNYIKSHNYIFGTLVVLILLAVSFASGRYTLPTKVITKTEVQTQFIHNVQTKWLTKTVYVHDIQKNIQTVSISKKLPSGEVDTTVTTTNLSKSEVSDKIQASSLSIVNDSDKTVSKTETITSSAKPQWFVSLKLGAGSSFPGLAPRLDLGIEVNKRLLGPVFVGVWLDLQSPVAPIVPNSFLTGISLGLEL